MKEKDPASKVIAYSLWIVYVLLVMLAFYAALHLP